MQNRINNLTKSLDESENARYEAEARAVDCEEALSQLQKVCRASDRIASLSSLAESKLWRENARYDKDAQNMYSTLQSRFRRKERKNTLATSESSKLDPLSNTIRVR